MNAVTSEDTNLKIHMRMSTKEHVGRTELKKGPFLLHFNQADHNTADSLAMFYKSTYYGTCEKVGANPSSTYTVKTMSSLQLTQFTSWAM